MRICPNCRAKFYENNYTICPYCHHVLQKPCLRCGSLNDIDERYCIQCGYPFIDKTSTANLNLQKIAKYKSEMQSQSLENSYRASLQVARIDSLSNSIAQSTSTSISQSVSFSEQSVAKSLYYQKCSNTPRSLANNSQTDNYDSANYSRISKYHMIQEIKHAISFIHMHLQDCGMSNISRHSQGDSTVLDNDNDRLKQAYSTFYSSRENIPKMYRLVHLYNLNYWKLHQKLTIINQMLLRLHISQYRLQPPIWAKLYSDAYSDYIKQFKGNQGETWAYNNLEYKKDSSEDISNNINIPFNYGRYYYNESQYYYNHHDFTKGNKYYRLMCKTDKYYKKMKDSNRKNRNSNQIDILDVDKYGIFIFEVKNYNHNKIWIDDHGRIAWENSPSSYNHYGHQNSSSSINRQMKLHRIAILSYLGKFNFTKSQWNKITHNIFNILVYIKAPKGSHGEVGVYKYDRSLRDYSTKFHIKPTDQHHCHQLVRGKQSILGLDLRSKIKHVIKPINEKTFYLPIFNRNDVYSFNTVLKYKKKLSYIYKLLCHICYAQGILEKITNHRIMKIFLYKRDRELSRLKNLHRHANYQFFNKKQGRWCKVDKKRSVSQYYHRKYLDKYNWEKRYYKKFYE